MKPSIHHFLQDQSGAITVDWVVLSAAIVGLGVSSVSAVRTGTTALGTDTQTALSGVEVASLGELGSGTGPSGPTVVNGGRGVAWFEGGTCDKSGICTPMTEHVSMTYEMSDGTYWSMKSVTGSDGVKTVSWTDQDGNPVDAPEFS